MKKTHYEKAPQEYEDVLLNAKEVKDFLPPPEQLIPKIETKKVTILLSKKSIDYFKRVSEKTNVPYQQLIRKVLDTYADQHTKS